MAIDVGNEHGIKLKPGTKNLAAGNCLYESCMDNINKRSCFTEELEKDPNYYRNSWNTLGEAKARNSAYYLTKYSKGEEWENAWKKLRDSNVWDLEYFGNLAIISCAHSLKKDILVFNTPWKTNEAQAHDPVSVISADQFDPTNKKNNEIPIVLAYNGTHFESLIPAEEDIDKTVDLVKKYKTGDYTIPRALQNVYKQKKPLNNTKTVETVQVKSKKAKRDSSVKNNSPDDLDNEWKTVSRKSKKKDILSEKLVEKKIKIKDMTPEQRKEYNKQSYQSRKQNGEKNGIKIKDMNKAQLAEYYRKQKKNERAEKRAEDEIGLKSKWAKEKQSGRDKERAEDETKFKSKRAKEQEKQREKKEIDSKARIK